MLYVKSTAANTVFEWGRQTALGCLLRAPELELLVFPAGTNTRSHTRTSVTPHHMMIAHTVQYFTVVLAEQSMGAHDLSI